MTIAYYNLGRLHYDKPWGWMQPARHALGALLLEQGRVEDMLAVYRPDPILSRPCRRPDNIWSLKGSHECLTRHGRIDEARQIVDKIARLDQRVDVKVSVSCFCRKPAA